MGALKPRPTRLGSSFFTNRRPVSPPSLRGCAPSLLRRYWSRFSVWVLGASCLLGARSAQAYRPFDGTDADVAAIGEFELELGALHYHQEGPEKLIQSPMVLNLGIVPRVELGADIASNVPLAPSGGPRFQLTDTDVFIKILLRSGVLQAETGPSIAVETGPMFPELNGLRGLGG